jgi:hypothetical protein
MSAWVICIHFALRKPRPLHSQKQTFARQRCHCMIGTALIAFAGEPLISFVLIAR